MSNFPYTPFPFNITPVSMPFDLSPVASNISQGWVPDCFTPECVPTASWSTSSMGAALSFQFWGWDVAFDGDIKGNMDIELLRDGVKELWNPSSDTLFELRGQPTDQFYLHNITLRVLSASPDAKLTVNQARVNGTTYVDSTLDSTRWIIPSNDTRLGYNGFTQQKSMAQAGSQTTHMSSRAGDTASMWFNASAFLLYGPCGPTNGLMKITIDNRESTINTSRPIASNDCLLFQNWGIPNFVGHQLLVENVDGAMLGIDRIEFFQVNMFGRSNPQLGAKAVVIMAGVMVTAIVMLVLVSLGVYLKNSRRRGKVGRGHKMLCL